jgi:hypothetical protein
MTKQTIREEALKYFKPYINDEYNENFTERELNNIADFFLSRTIPRSDLLAWLEKNKIVASSEPKHKEGFNQCLSDLTQYITTWEQ